MLSNRVGKDFGLKLTLFVDVEEYIGILSPNAGVRVPIHEPKISPVMKTESMAVATGEATFLSISKQEISRLGGKYGTCTKEWPKKLMLSEQITISNYSFGRCMKYCTLNQLLAECSCSDSYDFNFTSNPNLLSMSENGYFRQCDSTKSEDRNCSKIVYLSFADNSLQCPCETPC